MKGPSKTTRTGLSVLALFLRAWVILGFCWPDLRAEGGGTTATAEPPHWAFQPPADVSPPKPKRHLWVQSPIDAFILAKLEAAHLSPAPPADKVTLLRRVTFDLIGLPPTPDEIDAYLADQTENAFARVIDRLLASPHYGERWGRHWLDLARYADSNGQDENKAMANAWRYRDYVIRSFNQDKPFDQFIREQLAGDLLPATDDERVTIERRTATGFLVLGPKMLAEQDKPKLVMDIVDEQIDVVSRAFLGLTVSCSRCHDHKTDPIATRDYYALAGIFKSTKTMADLAFVSKWNEHSIATKEERARHEAYVKRTNDLARQLISARTQADDDVDARWDGTAKDDLRDLWFLPLGLPHAPAVKQPYYGLAYAKTIAELEVEQAALRTNAPPELSLALSVEEGTPEDVPVHLRGSHLSLGRDRIPRGFIAVLNRGADTSSGGLAPKVFPHQSGRLELAEWLTHPAQPLTARVAVNRLWQAHFGEGLVRSPDNFGITGERPSHPELLDWLARAFARDGWSFKRLHRLLLLSSTYQMSTRLDARSAGVDPENRLLWRMNRRRLEAEPIRDALLAIAGRLDRTLGGSLVSWRNADYTPDDTVAAGSRRRAVYLPVVRDRVYDVFTIFDFANPSVGVGRRTPTVVSHQALFFLNSPFVKEQARHLANALCAQTAADEPAIIRSAYGQVLGRRPSQAESARATEFLHAERARLANGKTEAADPIGKSTGDAWAAFCQALFASNEFLYVD